MKISLLNADLSNNCLGRTYLLAKVLQRNYDVEIIGPILGDKIWQAVAQDKSIQYKSVKLKGVIKPYWQILGLVNKIDGDVVYANKSLLTSFGVGILAKVFRKKPLVLDIDDWQMGFINNALKNKSFIYQFAFLGRSAIQLYKLNSYWNSLISEKLSYLADDITVSNNFLEKKFGGTIIPHGRNTDVFNPERFDIDNIKKKYKIDKSKKIVMFFGTVRKHKGVEDLIEAMNRLKNKNVMLVVVGVDLKDKYCESLINNVKMTAGKEFKWYGIQPFEKVPEFLAIADVVVVPQRKNLATEGQFPAKIFDAMAMAKPIISTDVNDISEVLNDCGIIIESGDVNNLKKSIEYILDGRDRAKEMGIRARKKCIEKYSWDVMEKLLRNVFDKYDKNNYLKK